MAGVQGLGVFEADTVACEVARLSVQGVSKWEIVFRRLTSWWAPGHEEGW